MCVLLGAYPVINNQNWKYTKYTTQSAGLYYLCFDKRGMISRRCSGHLLVCE